MSLTAISVVQVNLWARRLFWIRTATMSEMVRLFRWLVAFLFVYIKREWLVSDEWACFIVRGHACAYICWIGIRARSHRILRKFPFKAFPKRLLYTLTNMKNSRCFAIVFTSTVAIVRWLCSCHIFYRFCLLTCMNSSTNNRIFFSWCFLLTLASYTFGMCSFVFVCVCVYAYFSDFNPFNGHI